ncbi:MAG: hypothetical protein V6Z82_05340 [Flavobacteriales bacterium]
MKNNHVIVASKCPIPCRGEVDKREGCCTTCEKIRETTRIIGKLRCYTLSKAGLKTGPYHTIRAHPRR